MPQGTNNVCAGSVSLWRTVARQTSGGQNAGYTYGYTASSLIHAMQGKNTGRSQPYRYDSAVTTATCVQTQGGGVVSFTKQVPEPARALARSSVCHLPPVSCYMCAGETGIGRLDMIFRLENCTLLSGAEQVQSGMRELVEGHTPELAARLATDNSPGAGVASRILLPNAEMVVRQRASKSQSWARCITSYLRSLQRSAQRLTA